MAGELGYRVEGLPAVLRALKALGAEVSDLKGAFTKIAAEGAQLASRYAPKKSGRLAGDIRGNRAVSKAVIIAGRSSVPYAGPINYGWERRNISPTGFMQQASNEMEPRAVQMLEDEINQQIRMKGMS